MPAHPLTEIAANIREFVASSRPASSLLYPRIADEINYLRDIGSVIKSREDALTESIKLRMELESITERLPIPGKQTSGLIVIPVVQFRLNEKGIKEEMGESWYKTHCKEVKFIQIRTSK